MKIKFLRSVSVDVIDDSNNLDYLYYAVGEVIEVEYIDKVSNNFSNIELLGGDIAINVKNDCFEIIEDKPQTKRESIIQHLNVTC